MKHHKINFNYEKNAKLGPSEKSIELMRMKEAQMRKVAKDRAKLGNNVYNG